MRKACRLWLCPVASKNSTGSVSSTRRTVNGTCEVQKAKRPKNQMLSAVRGCTIDTHGDDPGREQKKMRLVRGVRNPSPPYSTGCDSRSPNEAPSGRVRI